MVLEVKKLGKAYDDGFALEDISFQVNEGDFMLLFGEDDAGKTSLLYQILGMQQFDTGQITVEKKDVRFVPDSVCMEKITAREYFATLAKYSSKYPQEDVVDICDYFSIDVDQKLTDMTYNDNKIAMIVGAIGTVPKLLILDEPLNFLTVKSGRKMLNFLRHLSDRGVAVLITADESKDILRYCDHFVYMKDGKIILKGNAQECIGRQKAITVSEVDAPKVEYWLGEQIANGNRRVTFLFDTKTEERSLGDILRVLKVSDIEIEDLTLEEMLDKDYSRWM